MHASHVDVLGRVETKYENNKFVLRHRARFHLLSILEQQSEEI